MNTQIKVENLTKIINKNIILEDVSLSFESGKIYGLQGINGSGKTMLMRTIIGLIRPTKGKVYINDKLLGKDIEFPESIGFLLENPTFLDSYSGFDNLKMLTALKKKVSDKCINDVLKKIGLEDAAKKKYKKYSLGMKQRLGIAAAVFEQPDIVILDEPTNALDSSGVADVQRIVQEQKERGALVIISCHDLNILEKLSDEIVKLEAGHVVDYIYNKENGKDE